ncbi:NtaA/DmoA family FMN-dependent monooxygenase [Paraburkholderia sp. Ac-20347]|uniref:NtaA/DmoA family FMN-dependent monooxygenase n=1 Tax=Paraburkholderia sp. Ac-20347 TaxID=2703892 RepID=UPI001980FA91|nr:NtaA/DmoA family FMN-dependent monooxygenase [Paraburkholderia sp. Ac-20347]MBN3814081.1 NtaA/DmoA family FMN-dependent monooxygenase [Paraburkholderia sp. Ac-20347]
MSQYSHSDGARRPLIYNAFAHVTPNHHSHGFWRHPEGQHQLDFHKLGPWIELAKTAERGCFDVVFLADVAGLYETSSGQWQQAARTGMQFPSHDPAALVSALAAATNDIGFAVTSSVIQEHPFSFARKLSTLDHLSEGRVAWNIVTSYLDNTARNYGFDKLPPHDERYVWGEEYAEVAYKLWEASWEDGAWVADAARDTLVDPARLHAIDHVGARYRVAGPHLVRTSPQRTPVLFQAGSSEAGRDFAARHAEVTFLPSRTPESAANDLADLRRRAVAAGRHAEDIRAIVMLSPVIGSTEAEAKARRAEILDSFSLDALAVFWSGGIGVDLTTIDPATPLTELREQNGTRGSVRAFIDAAPQGVVTFGDALRKTISAQFAGTPEQIADEVERWAAAGVAGFNVVPVTTLGWWSEFVDHVVPVLQKRGLMQREYAPGTLREKLFRDGPHLPDRHPARRLRPWAVQEATALSASLA